MGKRKPTDTAGGSKKRSRSSKNAVHQKTPAEAVYAVPEIRQRVLHFLDLPSLASFILVEKSVSHDVAQQLYREVPYKHMLNKMSRTVVSAWFGPPRQKEDRLGSRSGGNERPAVPEASEARRVSQ